MKYTTLATALSLALGSGSALAQQAQDPQNDNPQAQPQAQPPQQQQQPQQPAGQAAAADNAVNNVTSVDMLFETNSAKLTDNAFEQLKTLARWGKCNANGAIILEGHADPRGTQAYNLELSGKRAAAVREKLISMGVPSDRIVVTLYGENGPQRATFAEDRRVTIRATTRPIQPAAISAQR